MLQNRIWTEGDFKIRVEISYQVMFGVLKFLHHDPNELKLVVFEC